jgi:leucyl aminopeptidase/proline iminopeptidase
MIRYQPTLPRYLPEPRAIEHADLAQTDALCLVVNRSDESPACDFSQCPFGELLADHWDRFARDHRLTTVLPNARGTRVLVLAVDGGEPRFERLQAMRKGLGDWLEQSIARLDIAAGDALAEPLLPDLLLAIHLKLTHLPDLKRRGRESNEPEKLRCFSVSVTPDIQRIQTEASATGLCRFLTALPPNHLNPGSYGELVRSMADEEGWSMEWFGRKQLMNMGAGAFTAIANGPTNRHAGIVRLRYTPNQPLGGPIALVGKGITYDTGGHNLKTGAGLFGMHTDMGGSAAVLGALLAVSRLKLPIIVDAWLAISENTLNARAYRPNDVVTALDGTTIEVVDTDAEGRMVLADTLALAGREQPAWMIDFATLTGACVKALGQGMSGVFSNRTEVLGQFFDIGHHCGERLWPLPMPLDYLDHLRSDVADIRQCALSGTPDHIDAALFLSRFVPRGCHWAHIDLSSARNKDGLAGVDGEITGFGARLGLAIIEGLAGLEKIEH